MKKTPLTRLDLRTSLFYEKISPDKINFPQNLPENEEFLFCYDLNPLQCEKIEPAITEFLGKLRFVGRKTSENLPQKIDDDGSKTVVLPQGLYLFVQQRRERALNHAEWLDMAIEQQKDSLWERNKPGSLLYLRCLYEDGAVVTQLFRTIKN